MSDPMGDPTLSNSQRRRRAAGEQERSEAFMSYGERRMARARQRWAKAREEVARNRRGEYTVPTWVLAAALFAILGGIAALVIFA